MSIPLPGPFSYSTRIGGRRRRRSSGQGGQVAFWVLIGWWWMPCWLIMKWTVIGMWRLGVLLVTLAQVLVQQRSATPPHREQ